MTDLKGTLNRLGDQLPDPDGLEALDKRRHRRRRRDRILAGTVALLIAAVGTTSAYLAFRPSGSKVRPGQTTPSPDVARISCDGQTATVQTPTVRVQPDGVHLEVTNTASFEAWIVTEGSGSDGSPTVPAGETVSTVTEGLHPGESNVWCGPSRTDVNDDPPEAHLSIVDPDGIWVPSNLECPSGHAGGTDGGMRADLPTPEHFDPVQRTREVWADKLLTGDVVERAGYPEGRTFELNVRVVRDGLVYAIKGFSQVEDGLYDNGAYWACQEF